MEIPSAPSTRNPTSVIDLDFNRYLHEYEQELHRHHTKGVPDYSFAMDGQLRSRMSAMGGNKALSKVISLLRLFEKQRYLMHAVRVSPTQFPEIFEIGASCANQLGIGIPEMFIEDDPRLNAYTFAIDKQEPFIVLTSGLVATMSRDELHFVIGHECGHVHNLHGVYNTVTVLLSAAVSGTLQNILRLPLLVF